MNIASIIEQFREPFLRKYGHQLMPGQLRALDAITACKTRCGHFTCRCGHCHHTQSHALSCGHRSCPRCQNAAASQWLYRQQQKLIPAEYFMVTLTIPEQLRGLFCITHVKHTGKGLPALQYLSRYLYRGALSEKPSSKPMQRTSPSAIRMPQPAK